MVYPWIEMSQRSNSHDKTLDESPIKSSVIKERSHYRSLIKGGCGCGKLVIRFTLALSTTMPFFKMICPNTMPLFPSGIYPNLLSNSSHANMWDLTWDDTDTYQMISKTREVIHKGFWRIFHHIRKDTFYTPWNMASALHSPKGMQYYVKVPKGYVSIVFS